MSFLVLLMLWARLVEALGTLLIAGLAVGAAVAVPTGLSMMDGAIARAAVASAPASQRSVTLYSAGSTAELERAAPVVLRPSGFRQIYQTQSTIILVDPSTTTPTLLRLQHRDDLCANLAIVAGRCVMGTFEIVVGERTARRLGLRPGSVITTDEVIRAQQGGITGPAGNPREMTVVGIYRIPKPDDDYWLEPVGFQTGGSEMDEQPLYGTRLTTWYGSSRIQQNAITALMPSDRFAAARLDELQATVDTVESAIATGSAGGSIKVHNDIPELIARTRANIELAHAIAPVALVPLLALTLYVSYLTLSAAVGRQRAELALLALRGSPRGQRWWLAAGQPIATMLLAAPIGFLVAQLTIAGVARMPLVDGVELGPTLWAVIAAGVALLALVALCWLVYASAMRRPVVVLLRQTSPRRRAAPQVTVEVLVCLLAVLSLVQLRLGGLSGLASLVPGLVVAALALILARAVQPIAAAVARVALRRGRPGLLLGAAHLARRPGSHRLVVLVSVGVAMLGFCIASLDVAARARHDRAVLDTGATTVVELQPIEPRTLLAKVRAVDPTGTYGMAVVPVPSPIPVLAVDATRLAAAATWRSEYGVDPSRLARLLHPPAPAPFVVRGGEVTVRVENDAAVDADAPSLVMSFEPLAGGASIGASSGMLRPGRRTYRLDVPNCADGCRLSGFRIVTAQDPTRPLRVVLKDVTVVGSDVPVVSPADTADQARWSGLNGTTVEAGPSGLLITATPSARDSTQVVVLDAPYPLPVAATRNRSSSSDRLSSFDRSSVWNAVLVAQPHTVPRLGNDAVLVDLEYLDRITPGATVMSGAEVWLGASAPSDAVERLRAAGLPITRTRTVDQVEHQLADQGPALVLWLNLTAAVVGLFIALAGVGRVASADGHRIAIDLRHLVRQGLRRRDVRGATNWSILGVVCTGCVAGLITSWLGWWLAGGSIPAFVDARPSFGPQRWPASSIMAWAWLLTTLTIVAVAFVLAWRTRRLVLQREGR